MAKEFVEIPVIVVVDSSGDYGVGRDSEDAFNNYSEQIGDVTSGMRELRATLSVELPRVTDLKATVPHQSDEATMAVSVQ